jgi:hypothetical protein
VGAEP